MKKPYLLIITGRPGSGKTTFSQEMGNKLFLPVISRDALKEGYVHTFQEKHNELSSGTNKLVTEIFFQTISSLLEKNISLIAEAAFQHNVWKQHLKLLDEIADIHIIICNTSAEMAKERFIKRGLDNMEREYFHGDKAVQDAREGKEMKITEYKEPKLAYSTITVDTASGYKPTIAEIKKMIF